MSNYRIKNRLGSLPGLFLLSVVIVGALASSAPAEAPPGQVGVRLVDVPTDRPQDPRARLYIIDHVAPGTTIERRVEVGSGLDEMVNIAMYPAGASVEEGEFVFFEGKQPNELSEWVSISPQQLEIAPGSAAITTVEISVPADATSGERYGVIWAELPIAEADSGVSEITRVGVRIYLSVGSGNEPPSDFEIESLAGSRSEDGTPQVIATVHNTGQRALDLSGRLLLTNGPGGISAGPFPVRLGTTLGIGETEPVVVPLSREIPLGPWLARLTLRSGLLKRSAQATISFPEEAGVTSGAIPVDKEGLRWGFLGVGGIFLVALLFLFLFLWRRRRKKEEEDQEVAS